MWISDRINWIISKRAKPIFFKITSNQSISHDKSNGVEFGFGVDLLNMMASAVRGGLTMNSDVKIKLNSLKIRKVQRNIQNYIRVNANNPISVFCKPEILHRNNSL